MHSFWFRFRFCPFLLSFCSLKLQPAFCSGSWGSAPGPLLSFPTHPLSSTPYQAPGPGPVLKSCMGRPYPTPPPRQWAHRTPGVPTPPPWWIFDQHDPPSTRTCGFRCHQWLPMRITVEAPAYSGSLGSAVRFATSLSIICERKSDE